VTSPVLPVWWDEAADGPTNMAADELLADEAGRHGGPVVRVYSWTVATVSLGAFQALAEAEACPSLADLPIVRRPSGGGAIIHGTDLTYAAAVPKGHPWGAAPESLYDAMHEAMAATLADLGIAARRHTPTPGDPPAAAFLCFSRRAAGDLVVSRSGAGAAADDPKIMGSAQRRLAATVLQHGSLLLASNPGVAAASRHAGLAELCGLPPDVAVRAIAEPWLERVAAAAGIAVARHTQPFLHGREAAIRARADRFRDPRWTGRR
jgi:lipoate-protein ligase A